MSTAELFVYVRLRYSEFIGQMNSRQICPPDALARKIMMNIDAIVRPEYRQHSAAELDMLDTNIEKIHVFFEDTPAKDKWLIFRAQAHAFIDAARDDMANAEAKK